MKHIIARGTTTLRNSTIITALRTGRLAVLLTAAFALPALSQPAVPTMWELNSFGRYTDFGAATNLQSGVGAGVRLGYFVHPRWELEAGAGFTRADQIIGPGTENVVPVLLDVTYNLPIGWHQLLLGGGGVYNRYGSSHAWGTSLSAGVRLAFGRTAAFRVDGTREYINERENIYRHSNWVLRLGLSWVFPRRAITGERITVSHGELAIAERARTPVLRNLDPVAILGVETERLPEVRVVDLRPAGLRDSIGATIHFDVGSSEIRPDAITTLEGRLDLLRGIPTLRIRIEGQADLRGSNAYNIALAQRRATAAGLWLTDRGIAADRIEVVGFDKGRPPCKGSYESCWRNRRDEFVIVAGGGVVQGRQ